MILNLVAKKDGEIIEYILPPILRLTEITSFNDVIINESISLYFEKYFQYSLDGVTFSEKQELTNTNLNNIIFDDHSIFILKILYKRIGTDPIDLILSEFVLNGIYSPLSDSKYFHFNSSLFKKFFEPEDVNVLVWAVNVLQKLYYPGIVPKYISRNIANVSDEDYISFWFSVTHFFAIIVNYARLYKNFEENNIILSEFLRQKEIYFTENTDLKYLSNNFFDEIMKRGTYRTVEDFIINEDQEEFGELKRLFNWKKDEDFIFSLIPKHKVGWNLGNSSPLFKGEKNTYKTNKLKFLDNPDLTLINTTIDDSFVFEMGAESEISFKNIVVEEFLNYKLKFLFQKLTSSGDITVSVNCYDKDKVLINTYSAIDLSIESSFLSYSDFLEGKKYLFTGIIYNSHTSVLGDSGKLKLGFGNNLRFNVEAKYLDIVISSTVGGITIEKLEFLLASTKYSTGFINTNDFIQIYFKNNNLKRDFENILLLIREFFIPYNSWMKGVDFNNYRSYIPNASDSNYFYWKPDSPYCLLTPLEYEPDDSFCENITWEGIDEFCTLTPMISWQGENPFCINNTSDIITWKGEDEFCETTEIIDTDLITWQGIDPYCELKSIEIVEDVVTWEGIDPYCEIAELGGSMVEEWRVVNGICYQENGVNNGDLTFPNRERIERDLEGEFLDILQSEPNRPFFGDGPYFPDVTDSGQCQVP